MGIFLKNSKTLVMLTVVVLIVGLIFYLYLSTRSQDYKTLPITPYSSPVPTITFKSPTLSSLPTSSPFPTLDDTSGIMLALISKTGISKDNLDFKISQNTGKFAKGSVGQKDSMGGGYFLAVKVDNAWVIVYDGQANPLCSQVDPYNFPKDMVPECLDNKGEIVKR